MPRKGAKSLTHLGRDYVPHPMIGMQVPFGAFGRAVTPRGRGGKVDWGHLGSQALHIAQSKELAPVRDFLLHKAMQKVGAGYSMGGLLIAPVHPSHHMLHPSHHLHGTHHSGVRAKSPHHKKGGTKSPTGKSQEQIYSERLKNLAKARAVKALHVHHGAGFGIF